VFPVRYELNFYILLSTNSVLKGLMTFRNTNLTECHVTEIITTNYMHNISKLRILLTKSALFWDVMQCSPVKVYRRFGGPYYIHLHCRRRKEQSTSQQEAAYFLLIAVPACYLVGFLFDPEDSGNMFLRNVCEQVPYYTASYLKQDSS
jgi:hypothetical protein